VAGARADVERYRDRIFNPAISDNIRSGLNRKNDLVLSPRRNDALVFRGRAVIARAGYIVEI